MFAEHFTRRIDMRRTVLLVDYDPRSIDAIRRCLATLQVQTLLATDGESGEREFHRVRPDLTLVQDVLPKKRGVDLCHDLKSSAFGAHSPVLLLACVQPGARYRLFTSRCDDVIEKPFDEATLIAKVRKFLPDLNWSAA
jgi:DNA-binding response OmpR family regulator